MGKPDRTELDRIRRELAQVYNDAAWKAAALITRASTVRDGLDQPLDPEEWENLRLIIHRLNSAARHAEQVLTRLTRPFGTNGLQAGEARPPGIPPAASPSPGKGIA